MCVTFTNVTLEAKNELLDRKISFETRQKKFHLNSLNPPNKSPLFKISSLDFSEVKKTEVKFICIWLV